MQLTAWCLGGDFNVIRSSTEKLNGDRLTSSMKILIALLGSAISGIFLFPMPGSLGLLEDIILLLLG